MKDKFKKSLVLILFVVYLILSASLAATSQGGKFVFTQLKYQGNWDIHSGAWQYISEYLTATTSIKSMSERRVVSVTDKELMWSPFLVIFGDTIMPEFGAEEIKILRRFVNCGGIIFIEDSSSAGGEKGQGFDKYARKLIKNILPDIPLERVPQDDAMFKSFYMIRGVAGRIITNRYFEGCKIGDRYSIIYSQNDIFGAWEKDNLGNYLYPCDEKQRWEAKKMCINIIFYALTGTYKSDLVHKPFLKIKMQK